METMQQHPVRMDVLATVAHELRNPIAAIQSAVRVLVAANLATAARDEARAIIDRQVLRIARLSDDLLNAGYLSGGKLELRLERIDLRDLVGSAVETCRSQLDARGHSLALHSPSGTVALDADPVRITQVITNLIDNAAKYTERGGRIVVGIEDHRSEVSIRISDNGIGIPPELLPRIFDPFVQADHALAHSRYGMGIGLSLVKRIAELHQGTVDAYSAGLGKGSTFTVRLPRNP